MIRTVGSRLYCVTSVLIWTLSLLGVCYSGVYTSSKKIQDMVELEENNLNNLHSAISNLGNETASSCFLKFYRDRMLKIQERRNNPGQVFNLDHPNGIYLSIKQFAADYENIRSALDSASPAVQKYLSSIADQTDLGGARLSVLRLQTIYNLKPSDMVRGYYLGVAGPELSDEDAFEIGEVAFREGWLDHSIDWLHEALAKTKKREPSVGIFNLDTTIDLTGRIYALLGRCYIRKGDQAQATEMYNKVPGYDGTDTHALALLRELESKPEFKQPVATDKNYIRLCSLQNKLTQNKFDPRLKCRYKVVMLPYFRFKQELVSVSPYVVLFYDVITDLESEHITRFVTGSLFRGRIQANGTLVAQEIRTSDISFVYDSESSTVARMSQRIGAITNLSTKPYIEGGDYSCEPFQVVNYGMGGHYEMHTDTFDQVTLDSEALKDLAPHGGNRLATFLVYLTDVEQGGSTVFTEADLAVKPVKKMGLFWYNYKPSGEMDVLTRHAGCPVVIGHKWVTNKWIWLHGNAFTRRCGLTPDATQLNIEKYMRRGWA